MKKLFQIIISIPILLLIPVYSWGAECSWTDNAATVASPYDHTDVQNCVNEAAVKTGEVTISIPTATVNWDANVTINMATGWANVTALNIIGAGIGNTVITDTGTATAYGTARLFIVTSKSDKKIRISGITLTANTSVGTGSSSCLMLINGTGTETRLDTIQFNFSRPTNGANSNGIKWWQTNGAYGVIDNCTFNVTGANYGGNPIVVYGAGSGNGDTVGWRGRAFTPGTANATYIENNTITMESPGNDFYDAYIGARLVARYNTIHGSSSGGHGNDSSGTGDSVHTQEIYNNDYDNTCGASECNSGTNRPWAIMWRGGTGVFFNNRIDVNGFNAAAVVVNYRSNPYAEGTATNETPSSTVLYTTSTGTAATGNRVYRQGGEEGIAYCTITGVVANTSITCSAGLSGGKQWSSGDKFMVFYFPNTDGGCDGNSPADGNVADNQGWLCRQQVGSTYDSGYVVKPIYAWGNVYNGTTEGHLTVGSGSTRHSTYHVKPNQTFFNCDSAADCKTDTDAVNIPGFGEDQGWTYTAYTCPHPLVGSGTCLASTAGKSGYSTGSAAPTLTSATIGTNGTTLTLVFSEAVNASAITGLSISIPSGPATISLVSGSGTTSLVTTISRTVTQSVTGILLSYTQPGDEIEATDDQADLASFSNLSVVNNSTQSNTVRTVTPSAGTGCTISPSTAQSIVNGLTAQFTYGADINYQFSAWGGTCGGSGTTTYTTDAITADCTVSVSCTKISPDVTIGSGAAVTLGTGAVGTLY